MSRKAARRRHTPEGLTDLELRFCFEYVVDFKGGPALRRAGSTAEYVDQQAYEMLRKPHIVAKIEALIAQANERSTVDKDWLKTELVLLYRSALSAADVYDDKGKRITTNPAERATALRTLEKIGQHVDVNAFRAQIGLGNADGSNFDFSGLSDEMLEQLETILSAAALAAGGPSRDQPTTH